MSGHGYIYVHNWDRFQHYKRRRPAWIKLYLDLLERDEYRDLTLAERGLLQDLWKLVGMLGDGRVSADRVSLARRLNVRRVSLEPLINAGFIEVRASKALAEVLAPEKEKREREEIQVQPTVAPVAATQKQRQRNEQWDALEEIFGYTPGAQNEQQLWGKLIVELRAVHATHDTILEAAQRYPADMPGATLTPPALVKHYQRLMAPTWHAPNPNKNGRGAAADTIHLMQSEQRRQLGTP